MRFVRSSGDTLEGEIHSNRRCAVGDLAASMLMDETGRPRRPILGRIVECRDADDRYAGALFLEYVITHPGRFFDPIEAPHS
jgi:hypothetical protein